MRTVAVLIALVVAVVAVVAIPSAPAEKKQADWTAILAPSPVELPPADPEIADKVFTDFKTAEAEAFKRKLPLLIEVRCPKVKDPANMADTLKAGSPLADVLRRFVKLAIDDMRYFDLNQIPTTFWQDPDKMRWFYIVSPTGSVHTVFGDPAPRTFCPEPLSEPCENWMRSFLAYYHNPSRPDWGVDPPPSGERRRPMTFETHPGFGQWASNMGINTADMKCIFCHRTPGIVVTPELKKSYDRNKRVYDLGLPLAEQLGVEFDSTDLAIVGQVEEGSPAAKAGVEVGDMLGGINGRRVFGVSDLRVWMGQVPMKGGELKIVLLRGGKAVETTVKLSDGWKKYDIGWRRSIAISTMGAHPGFAWSKALTPAEREQRGLAADSLAITPQFPKDTSKSPAFNAGLRPQHVITAINGKSPDLSGNAVIVWFRMNTMPGDDIELTILDGAAKKTIKYKAVVR